MQMGWKLWVLDFQTEHCHFNIREIWSITSNIDKQEVFIPNMHFMRHLYIKEYDCV